MKDVSVVIVNYRVKYFLEQTILSTQEALNGLKGEIIVIDNDSGDDSIEYLKSKFKDVIFIENAANVGFARANNMGFDIASGKYTLILNPDTIIGEKTIHDCIGWYKSHPDCGGIGVMMIDGNGNFLPESKRAFPTPWVSFCKIFGLSSIFPYSKYFAKYHLRYLDKSKPHQIDILAGAFIFIKTDILKRCNGFDTDFFMYGEDIDLSYRITELGYRNYYIPTPIIHYKGESTKKNSMKYVRVFYEAMLIFFKKHYPHYGKVYSLLIKFAIVLRALIAASKRLLPSLKGNSTLNYNEIFLITNQATSIIRQLPENCSYTIVDRLSNLSIESNRNRKLVIFDNRICSYQSIIESIRQLNSPFIDFAIYTSQADTIITP